jgi:hypothetical protein
MQTPLQGDQAFCISAAEKFVLLHLSSLFKFQPRGEPKPRLRTFGPKTELQIPDSGHAVVLYTIHRNRTPNDAVLLISLVSACALDSLNWNMSDGLPGILDYDRSTYHMMNTRFFLRTGCQEQGQDQPSE